MPREVVSSLDFGEASAVDRALSESVRGLVGSEILKIAAEIRKLTESGRAICNLTVGDFNPRYFPLPAALLERLHAALDAGETNYPPANGLAALRRAVVEYTAREWGARYPIESVLIASGARPILYAAYRSVLNPGDSVVYPVPSWNNNHYAWVSGARGIAVPTRAADGFMPTLDDLAPHLEVARLICLNSPLNPAGTVISAPQLKAITEAVVQENLRRKRIGRPYLFLVHDGVYASLVFGAARHHLPVVLVPEAAPWVIEIDGISKSLAATGLRVGWVLAAPELVARMKDLIGHVGAWAPRAEQVAAAGFLDDVAAVRAFHESMNARVQERLQALHDGIVALKRRGYPVDCIEPQGAIYLSLRLDLAGRRYGSKRIETNEDVRQLLLEEAGIAVVPFQAFGLEENSGWFRLSVGAVSVEDVEAAIPRLASVLDGLG